MATTYTDRIQGVRSSVAVKAPVDVATTAEITLSGLQEIDGVTVAAGDRVLVKDQGDSVDNGIWIASSGAWSRAIDFDGARDVVRGTQIFVTKGTENAEHIFRVSTDDPVIGSSSVEFTTADITIIEADARYLKQSDAAETYLTEANFDSSRPLNMYLFPSFPNQDDTHIVLHISPNGVDFKRLNNVPMIRGGGDATVGGRDCQAFWCAERQEWLFCVTAGDAQDYDFSIWSTPDGTRWKLNNIYLNNGAGVRGTTLPGAVTAAPQLWSPRLVRDTDGTVYVTISIRTGPNYTNAFGNTSAPCFRPYIAECTDLDDLTFGNVTALGIGTASQAKLDPDFLRYSGTWYCAIKDSVKRNIEIWSAATLTGTWTEGVTLDLDGDPDVYDSLEGPTWAPYQYIDAATGDAAVKWRVHVASNRDENDDLKGVPYFFESTTSPAGPYGSAQPLEFAFATRNGTITNVALDSDPNAMRSLQAMIAAYSGNDRSRFDAVIELPDGAQDLYPQQDYLYFTDTAGEMPKLTIAGKVADRFYVGSMSIYSDSGVEIVGNSFSRSEFIGFASPPFHVCEFRWDDEHETYIIIGQGTKERFRAYMDGTQTVDGTATLEFDTSSRNIGGGFDVATYGWTPGRGEVGLRAQVTVTDAVDGDIFSVKIKRDATAIATTHAQASASGKLSIVTALTSDPASSTAEYTVEITTPASRTISGTSAETYFEGWQV